MMNNWKLPDMLVGKHVQLIPLEATHASDLVKAAADGKLWELWYTSVPSEKTIGNYIDQALAERDRNRQLPFTIVEKQTGTLIGSTRYYNLQPEHRRLEIGYTWYAKKYQRTAANTECKLLLLEYAFEKLNCIAVQFMTNWHNIASRKAIARLGAKQDGVLRNHRIDPDGSFRDSVVFSITDQEWPSVKKSLQLRLSRNS